MCGPYNTQTRRSRKTPSILIFDSRAASRECPEAADGRRIRAGPDAASSQFAISHGSEYGSGGPDRRLRAQLGGRAGPPGRLHRSGGVATRRGRRVVRADVVREARVQPGCRDHQQVPRLRVRWLPRPVARCVAHRACLGRRAADAPRLVGRRSAGAGDAVTVALPSAALGRSDRGTRHRARRGPRPIRLQHRQPLRRVPAPAPLLTHSAVMRSSMYAGDRPRRRQAPRRP